MLVPSKVLFDRAYGNFCIPAINVSNPEQVLSLFKVASAGKAPIIVQTTPAAREYVPPQMLLSYIATASKLYPDVIYSVHIDHGYESHIADAIQSGGYTSVMIDASHDPLEKNITRTRFIVKKAHARNITVEAELGVLSGKEDDLDVSDDIALYTDPSEAEYFVKETDCDALAVAVGTSHGAYKFSGGEGLRFDLLKKIQNKLPNFPIVLHGASSINPDDVKRINEAGGGLHSITKGISERDIKKAISYGVCKLNIATDLRLLWTRIFREHFRDNNGDWDHLIPGKQYMKELEPLLTKKFEMLENAGKNHLYN